MYAVYINGNTGSNYVTCGKFVLKQSLTNKCFLLLYALCLQDVRDHVSLQFSYILEVMNVCLYSIPHISSSVINLYKFFFM